MRSSRASLLACHSCCVLLANTPQKNYSKSACHTTNRLSLGRAHAPRIVANHKQRKLVVLANSMEGVVIRCCCLRTYRIYPHLLVALHLTIILTKKWFVRREVLADIPEGCNLSLVTWSLDTCLSNHPQSFCLTCLQYAAENAAVSCLNSAFSAIMHCRVFESHALPLTTIVFQLWWCHKKYLSRFLETYYINKIQFSTEK